MMLLVNQLVVICNAEKNGGQYHTYQRHPIILKKFATALFLLTGPLAYEFIYHNIPEALCKIFKQSFIQNIKRFMRKL